MINIECLVVCVRTYYCLELVPFAAIFAINGAAPPSREFRTTPVLLTPSLVAVRPPLKKGRRSTGVLL